MFDKWKNVIIGIFVAVAVGLVVWVLLFLHPSFGDDGKILRVRFPNIDKVGVGTRVTYAGRPIGEVIAISLVPDARQDADKNDPIFCYQLSIAVDSHVSIFSSDDFQIKSSGLMGEKTIAITPQRSKSGESHLLENNALIYATVGTSVEDTVAGLNNVTKKAERTLDELSQILEKNQQSFQETLKAIEGTTIQVESFIKRANELDLPGKIAQLADNGISAFKSVETIAAQSSDSKIMENLSEAALNVKEITAKLKSSGDVNTMVGNISKASENLATLSNDITSSWGQINGTFIQLSKTLTSADTVITKISEGQGSLGKLINSDDFYFNTQGILTKANTLMSDVNNYGVLFHLDKSWQRQRKIRSEEVANLKTPSEFKSFLNGQLQNISVAISGVSLAIDKANEKLPNNKEFNQTLTELSEQLKGLENSLRQSASSSIATDSIESTTD